MKIKYKFINGETTDIEVEDNIGTWILDSRRMEENLARKERYHCLSTDGMDYEGAEFGTAYTAETEYISDCKYREIYQTLMALEPVQRKRMLLSIAGKSSREIAELEGVSHVAVCKSLKAARKKFEIFINEG